MENRKYLQMLEKSFPFTGTYSIQVLVNQTKSRSYYLHDAHIYRDVPSQYLQLVLMKTEKLKNCFISLFKLCKYVANNIFSFLEHPINLLLDQIIYYCRYDKRKKRINYAQKF